MTGTGKTDLLHLLDEKGIDVLDLEGIAKNSGSTFGFITFDKKPPSQKNFETKLFESIFFRKRIIYLSRVKANELEVLQFQMKFSRQ